MTCLLIDDDLDDQEIFVMALRSVNPSVECMLAGNGFEALEKLKRLGGSIHDFIFIDLNMPRMGGIETLAEINNLFPDHTSTIIIYSTTLDKKVITKAMANGADHFLVKPFSIGDLENKLKEIFTQFTKPV